MTEKERGKEEGKKGGKEGGPKSRKPWGQGSPEAEAVVWYGKPC